MDVTLLILRRKRTLAWSDGEGACFAFAQFIDAFYVRAWMIPVVVPATITHRNYYKCIHSFLVAGTCVSKACGIYGAGKHKLKFEKERVLSAGIEATLSNAFFRLQRLFDQRILPAFCELWTKKFGATLNVQRDHGSQWCIFGGDFCKRFVVLIKKYLVF